MRQYIVRVHYITGIGSLFDYYVFNSLEEAYTFIKKEKLEYSAEDIESGEVIFIVEVQ